jgi:uncharacterized membrane protein
MECESFEILPEKFTHTFLCPAAAALQQQSMFSIWQVLVVISPLCSVLVRSPLYLLYIKYVLFVLVRATRYTYCTSETDLAQSSALLSILHF